jgi:hypothetical protein
MSSPYTFRLILMLYTVVAPIVNDIPADISKTSITLTLTLLVYFILILTQQQSLGSHNNVQAAE